MKAEENNKKNTSKVEKKSTTANKKTTTSTKTTKTGTKKSSTKTATQKKVETKKVAKTKPVAEKTAKTTKTTTSTTAKTKKSEPKKVEAKKIETKKVETKKPESKKVETKKVEVKKVDKQKTEKNINDKVLIKETLISNEEAKKVGIVLAIIIGVFCLFFFMTKLLKKDDHSDIFVEGLDVAEIQYTDILIGNMLKQNESEYYVLIENNEEEIEEIVYYAQNYQSLYDKTKDSKLYTAQLNNAFNKKYYGKTDSYEANSLSFSKTTLVKVSNGSIVEAYAQHDDIANKLEGLIGTVSY